MFCTLKRFTLVASLVAAAAAQNVAIGYPDDGASVRIGQNITVQVNRPNSLSGSHELVVVISLLSCPSAAYCANTNASDRLGSTLYLGPYAPAYHSSAPLGAPPHQNFSVQVPTSMTTGPARLAVTHVSLIGAGPSPYLEVKNITLNVV